MSQLAKGPVWRSIDLFTSLPPTTTIPSAPPQEVLPFFKVIIFNPPSPTSWGMARPNLTNTLHYVKLCCIPLCILPFIILYVTLPYLIPHFPPLHYNNFSYVALCYTAFHTITLLTLLYATLP